MIMAAGCRRLSGIGRLPPSDEDVVAKCQGECGEPCEILARAVGAWPDPGPRRTRDGQRYPRRGQRSRSAVRQRQHSASDDNQ